MQNSILEHTKVAEKGADYVEQAGLVNGTGCLVGQPGKMVNFIRQKISDCMGLSQPTLTIPASQVKGLAHFHIIVIQGGLARHIKI